MSDEGQGPNQAQWGGKQRELWAAVKRFMASHPEAKPTEAFSHVGEQYGRSASGVASAFYRIDRLEGKGDSDEGDSRTRTRTPNAYRTILSTCRRQLAVVERAAQALGENLDDLERTVVADMASHESDRQRLAELETVLTRLNSLLPSSES